MAYTFSQQMRHLPVAEVLPTSAEYRWLTKWTGSVHRLLIENRVGVTLFLCLSDSELLRRYRTSRTYPAPVLVHIIKQHLELRVVTFQLDGILSKKRYLTGDSITEVDVGLYTILVRFDRIYYKRFNVRRIFKYCKEQSALSQFCCCCQIILVATYQR